MRIFRTITLHGPFTIGVGICDLIRIEVPDAIAASLQGLECDEVPRWLEPFKLPTPPGARVWRLDFISRALRHNREAGEWLSRNIPVGRNPFVYLIGDHVEGPAVIASCPGPELAA